MGLNNLPNPKAEIIMSGTVNISASPSLRLFSIGENVVTSNTQLIPKDVSKYKSKTVIITNNTDKSINLSRVRFTDGLAQGILNNKFVSAIEDGAIAVGAQVVFSDKECHPVPATVDKRGFMSVPFIGMFLDVQIQPDTIGTFDYVVIGEKE